MTISSPDERLRPSESSRRNFVMRLVAAMIMAPIALGIAWLGGFAWTLLVMLAAIGLFVEWLLIVGERRASPAMIAGIAALVISAGLIATGMSAFALLVVAIGAGLIAFLAPDRRGWAAGGLVYAAAALLAAVVLRLDPTAGLIALILTLLIVWVTDILGYFVGRNIGGPKLWPRVSPKKTWSGAIGGLAGSLAVAGSFAALGYGRTYPLLVLGAVLSVASQLGDLFESAVKRRFGVKDSSQIIPGHGGLLDRLDGFVAAVVVAAAIGLYRGGDVAYAGRNLLNW